MRYIVAYGAAAIRELESAGFPPVLYFDGADICGSYRIGDTDKLEFYFIREGAFE